MSPRQLQSLRGLACVSLVLYHVVGGTPEQGLRLAEGALRWLCDTLASVRMPLFALLAGALHQHSRHSGWALLQDKAGRLLLPMLTVGTVFALVQSWAPGNAPAPLVWQRLHLLPVAHFWFLESLFGIFVLVTAWQAMGGMKQAWSRGLLAAAAVAAYLAGWGSPWLGLAGLVYLLPFFLLGQWLVSPQALGVVTWLRAERGRQVALGCAALFAVLVCGPAGAGDRLTLPMLLTGALATSALWLLPLHQRGLAWLGDRSYTVFLFHVFFTAATRMALLRMGVTSLWVQVPAGVLMGLLGPALLHALLLPQPWAAQWLLGQRPPLRLPADRGVTA